MGATACLVVCPYFLLPGKHWSTDIPRLVADAAQVRRALVNFVINAGQATGGGRPAYVFANRRQVVQRRLLEYPLVRNPFRVAARDHARMILESGRSAQS